MTISEPNKNGPSAVPELELFQSAVDRSAVAFAFCEPDRRIKWVNRAYSELTGFASDEAVGKLTRELVLNGRELEPDIEFKLENLPQSGDTRFDCEIHHKDGRPVYVDVCFRAFQNSDGSLQGFVMSMIDITSIERLRKRATTLLDQAASGIVVQDHDGSFINANEEGLRLMGVTQDQAMGRTPYDPLWRVLKADGSPNPIHEHPPMLALKSGKPVHDEVIGIETPDGERRWLLVNSNCIPNEDDGRRNVISSFIDITATKEREDLLVKANQEMERAQHAAEEAARVKSDFLATMSHEIRTPLNGVMGMLQILEMTELDDGQKDMLATAFDSANSLLHLINDILDYSKIEGGHLELEMIEVDSCDLGEKIANQIRPQAEDKGINLSVSCPESATRFHGDPTRIRQLLANLASNAIKFTQEGEVRIELEVVATEDGPVLRGGVVDTGIGIAEDKQASLFTRFSQADNSITRRFGGTGLGLAICRELTDLMGGTLGVKSRPGEGSTFWFEIPCAKGGTQDAGQEDEAPGNADDLHILVAEDHKVNQRVVQLMIKALGHRATIVENGQEALDALAMESFDFILMDIHMPVMDGLTAAEHIVAMDRHPPLWALTADAMPDRVEKYFATGFDGIIAKPLQLAELVGALATLDEEDTGKAAAKAG